MRRTAAGSTRPTVKPSPRSRLRGRISCWMRADDGSFMASRSIGPKSERELFLLALRLAVGERHGGFGREHAESQALLDVEVDGDGRVIEIADGEVLADHELEIAAPLAEHDRAVD